MDRDKDKKGVVSESSAVMQYIKQKATLMATFCDCVFLIKDWRNIKRYLSV